MLGLMRNCRDSKQTIFYYGEYSDIKLKDTYGTDFKSRFSRPNCQLLINLLSSLPCPSISRLFCGMSAWCRFLRTFLT